MKTTTIEDIKKEIDPDEEILDLRLGSSLG